MKHLFVALAFIAFSSCHTSTSVGQELSAKHFHQTFRNGGWVLRRSFSIYPNDSIGTWDWEDGEGDGTPPMMAWGNDTLYSFFIYGLSEEVRNNDKGSYQYDEAHRRFHISGFSFWVFWKNLNDLEVISINELPNIQTY